MAPLHARDRHPRILWSGIRGRGIRQRELSAPAKSRETEKPKKQKILFRNCGKVDDIVRAFFLVVPWSQNHPSRMGKPLLDWMHPGQQVAECLKCARIYLVVHKYVLVWQASRRGEAKLPDDYNVSTLDGQQLADRELKKITAWVIART